MIITDDFSKLDGEDFGYLLPEVESSLGFKFEDNELAEVSSYGQFLDVVFEKMSGTTVMDCTSQQAFYKIRRAMVKSSHLDKSFIKRDTPLVEVFGKKSRLSLVRELEGSLGFKLNATHPPMFITIALVVLQFYSFVLLFANWKLGLIFFAVSYYGLSISKEYGRTLRVKTVGELAKHLSIYNYINVRRDASSYNKMEVENILADILFLDKKRLTREAVFV